MATILDCSKLVEIYVSCDDFYKNFSVVFNQFKLHNNSCSKKPTRVPSLTNSEIMSICIFYHLTDYKCFQYYYNQIVLKHLRSDFPKLVSYERFVALIPNTNIK
jgi:hypothetical protein